MLNRATLTGRLTKDPELRYTPSGIAVATFTLAVNRTFVNGNGEKETDFVPIVVWRKAAENCANYIHKGSLVGIEGRLQTRSYDAQDGSKRFAMEVVADSVAFLEPKKNSQQGPQPPNDQNSNEVGFLSLYDDPLSDLGI